MNPNVVNFIFEHIDEDKKICSICHDEDNLISKDNSLVLTCCHVFHMECGVKSLIETHMHCPMCRSQQNLTWGKAGVYFPMLEYAIDNDMHGFISIIHGHNLTDLTHNNHILEYSILTENISMLKLIHNLSIPDDSDDEYDEDDLFQTSVDKYYFTIQEKKYKVLEHYAKARSKCDINELLLHGIMQSNLYVIMYMIYEFGANLHNKPTGGRDMLYHAIRVGSFEIVSYLIHDRSMKVYTYDIMSFDKSAISYAFNCGNYDIIKLCIQSTLNTKPIHSNKPKHEKVINILRLLIIKKAIKKLGNSLFSIVICNMDIYKLPIMELFELFYGNHNKLSNEFEKILNIL
jgi:hypothetical protein